MIRCLSLLAHGGIILSLLFFVFEILDWYNPYMNFLGLKVSTGWCSRPGYSIPFGRNPKGGNPALPPNICLPIPRGRADGWDGDAHRWAGFVIRENPNPHLSKG